MNTEVHPPVVERLNYEFRGWLGDDILESFPCFIVSDRLKVRIETEGLNGISFYNVIITKSSEFIDLYPDKGLPMFYWAKINGEIYKDDFAIGEDFRLVISDKADFVLNLFNVKNALFEDL